MLQETQRRLAGLECGPAIVVCNAEHRFMVAEQLQGVDVSWIVGLAVICPLYYVLMKRSGRVQRTTVPAPETTPAAALARAEA